MIHPSWIGLIVVNLTSICRWWGSMPFDNWLVTFEVHQSWYFSEIKFVYTYVDWDVQWLKKIGMVVWLLGTCWTRQLFLSWEVIYFKCSLTFKLVKKEQSLLSFFQIQVLTFIPNEREYYLFKKGNYYLFICPVILRMSYIEALRKFYLRMAKVSFSSVCYLKALQKS